MTDMLPFGILIDDEGEMGLLIGGEVYDLDPDLAMKLSDYFADAARVAEIRRVAKSN